MGTKILDYANRYLRRFQNYSETSIQHRIKKELLISGIKNYHLALGYLLASKEMRKLNRTIPLRHLLTLETSSPLKDLISTEKRVRREKSVNSETLRNLQRAYIERAARFL